MLVSFLHFTMGVTWKNKLTNMEHWFWWESDFCYSFLDFLCINTIIIVLHLYQSLVQESLLIIIHVCVAIRQYFKLYHAQITMGEYVHRTQILSPFSSRSKQGHNSRTKIKLGLPLMVPHLVYQFQIICFRELKLLVETKCRIDRYMDRRTLVKLNTPMSGGGGGASL